MKKLFLLPVIALFAVMIISLASATNYYCYINYDCSDYGENGWSGDSCGVCWGAGGHHFQACRLDTGQPSGSCDKIPEFGTIGMGLAITGAGLGYALIKKKRK